MSKKGKVSKLSVPPPLSVYPCGVMVKLWCGVEGMITAHCSRFTKIEYEVTYYVAGDRKTVWVDESEFCLGGTKSQRIGYKTSNH